MELIEAIKFRTSIRHFESTPVPPEIISKVLDIARYSPSGTNTQPWEFIVLTGKSLEKLKSIGISKTSSGIGPDNPTAPYKGVFRERQVVLGKEMFRIMGIEREDQKQRQEWVLEGMRFFGAPMVILICMDNEYYSDRRDIASVNIGIVTYAITLAALEFKLGTCIQFQGLMFAKDVRKALNIPETKHLASCISIGYPDWKAPINNFRAGRESLDKMTSWMS
jgi:nitroreductase